MRYPEFLPDNGRIGLIAPSFGCTRVEDLAQLESAVSRLESMGCSVVEGPNCRLALGVGKSNSPEKNRDGPRTSSVSGFSKPRIIPLIQFGVSGRQSGSVRSR